MTGVHASFRARSLLGLLTQSLVSQGSAASSTLRIAKIWARIGRYGSGRLWRLPSRICKNADLARIETLAYEMVSVLEREPTCAAKYTDYAFWIPFNVARVGALSLHTAAPLRILDIGCGPGYFLAAARACGHQCYGIDAPASILSEVENRVYSEMLPALGCDRYVSPLLIERFVPTPLPYCDLDAITAFWICFNRHRQADEWGVSEWRFFVDDAMSYLRIGGFLHLELNSHPERYGSLDFYDEETLGFFRSVGTVQGGAVRIVKGKSQEWRQSRKPA
jgi:SAM-dependent methyltransferase